MIHSMSRNVPQDVGELEYNQFGQFMKVEVELLSRQSFHRCLHKLGEVEVLEPTNFPEGDDHEFEPSSFNN